MYSVFEEAMLLENITKMHCIFEHQKIDKGATLTNKISSNLAEYEIQSSSQAQSRQVSPENSKLGTFFLVKCLEEKKCFPVCSHFTKQSGRRW